MNETTVSDRPRDDDERRNGESTPDRHLNEADVDASTPTGPDLISESDNNDRDHQDRAPARDKKVGYTLIRIAVGEFSLPIGKVRDLRVLIEGESPLDALLILLLLTGSAVVALWLLNVVP